MSNRTTDDERAVGRHDYDRNPDERGKWVSALIAGLGAWMVLEAVAFDLILTQFLNDVLVGALLLTVGGYNVYRRANARVGSVEAAVVVALVGLWLVISPFVLGTESFGEVAFEDLTFWNDLVAGLIALALGAYSAHEAKHDRRFAGGTTV